jgi:hypothetical protein
MYLIYKKIEDKYFIILDGLNDFTSNLTRINS